MMLENDCQPEAMDSDLRADIVRIIPEKMSDMCVGPFSISTLSTMYLTNSCAQIPPCFVKHQHHS